MSLPIHGANPHHVYERLGITKPNVILDFSENVNPIGPPRCLKDAWNDYYQLLPHYPDPNGEPFWSTIAAHHQVEKEYIFIGNGAAEIFSLVAKRYTGKRAIIVHPTFVEYETTLTATGATIEHIICDDIVEWKLPIQTIKSAMIDADVLYLCTPNNPTGVLPSREELVELVAFGAEVSCDVILDEAFIDWVPTAESLIEEVVTFPQLMVVRSMTKMYAIPGIRLGYLVAHPDMINEVRKSAPHWHINGLAAVIGARCLEEQDYVLETVRHAGEQLKRFQQFLAQYNCLYTNSVTNYLSFQLPDPTKSEEFYQCMLANGIVLRHSENFRGMSGNWFRVGMKRKERMDTLMAEMQRYFERST